MYPSPDNNSDHENPYEPLLLKKPSFYHHHLLLSDHHQNPYDNHDPSFFLNFPSPFFDEHELPLNQILPPHNPVTAPVGKPQHQTETNFGFIKKNETAKRGLIKPTKLIEKADNDQPSKRQNLGVVSRKRTGKKDRHSKICTAQGIRDRRMRLSLQIARKFFDLQDMLGYDKASSTIEWLFSKSKKAIKDLMKQNNNYNPQGNNNNFNFSASDGKTESFLSECEVVSEIHEVSSKNAIIRNRLGDIEKKWRKITRKPNNNLRESREKARARARWRTREKMMIKRLENSGQLWANFSASPNYQNDVDLQKLGFSNRPLEGVTNQELSHDVGTIEKLLGNSILSTPNACPISDNYNYQCCIDPNSTFMGFLGNWELLSNTERSNGSQFTVTNQGSSAEGNCNISINLSGATPNLPLFRQ